MDQPLNEFSVVCQDAGGAHFRVRVLAPTAQAAVGAAVAQGHDAKLAYRSNLPEAEKRRALEALRAPSATCPVCGYPLAGLPEGEAGHVTCPECGAWRGAPGSAHARYLADTLAHRGVALLLGLSVSLSLIEALRLMQARVVPSLAGFGLAIGVMVFLTSSRRKGRKAIVLAAAITVIGIVRLIWS